MVLEYCHGRVEVEDEEGGAVIGSGRCCEAPASNKRPGSHYLTPLHLHPCLGPPLSMHGSHLTCTLKVIL